MFIVMKTAVDNLSVSGCQETKQVFKVIWQKAPCTCRVGKQCEVPIVDKCKQLSGCILQWAGTNPLKIVLFVGES